MAKKQNIKVLIVEDNRVFLDTIKEIFESSGFTVVDMEDPKGIQEKIKQETPDIIMLDIMLPGISGFQLCKEIRKNSDFFEIPIILMTAADSLLDIEKAFSLGADDCFLKPFNIKESIERIKRLVNKKNTKILLVEDDRELCEMLKTLFNNKRYDIVVVYDGINISAVIDKERPDIILLDISLSVPPDGIEICKNLKGDINTKSIPILMLTANEEVGAVDKCFEYGADDYIFKPFKIPDLLTKIKKYAK